MKLYLLNLNGAEAGTFTERQLRAMWSTGAITVQTEWREQHDREWRNDSALPGLLEDEPAATDEVTDVQPSIQRRGRVRDETAYPLARRLLRGLCILFTLAALAAWVLALGTPGDSSLPFFVEAVAVTVTAAAYLALALVAQAVLNFADCELKP
jgi:hypothetical protein